MQIPFEVNKFHFRWELGQEEHQHLKIHELKSMETVKDGG